MNFIRYDSKERIALITLDRPDNRNALNAQMIGELHSAFERAEKEQTAKVIVLRANGTVFSAGADLEYLLELQRNSLEDNLEDSRNLKDLLLRIRNCPRVVIAQVQGHAIAGGCGLVSVCDLVFSASGARFGYTECKIGFVPALVAGFLCQRIGEGRARELLLTGSLIDAETARSYGLVNYIAEADQLEAETLALARRLVKETSAGSITYTKQLLAATLGLPMEEGMEIAAALNARARLGDDFKKGVQAFLAKDKPRW